MKVFRNLGCFTLFTSLTAAQCPVTTLISGLQTPLAITQSNQGNLLVSESGGVSPNTGQISLIDPSGGRRILIAGLPSGINDVGMPSGPAGLFLRGRTLYVAIGVGDVGIAGPIPGSDLPNPHPSSPLFSSILAVHFSADAEKVTDGFTLTAADQQALASGQKLILSNTGGDRMSIELVANILPDYVPKPLPGLPENVGLSNPFALVAVADQLYVTDGGRNLVWRVDIPTGTYSILAEFPPVANPLFPAIGGPTEEAVPTGIIDFNGRLLVALFRGAPFAPGTSVVEQVDPAGNHSPLINGLKTAIAVLPIQSAQHNNYLVLQHASAGPFFGSPGLLLRFASPAGPPTVIANCLTRPTAMALDEKTSTLYVTDLGGHVLRVSL